MTDKMTSLKFHLIVRLSISQTLINKFNTLYALSPEIKDMAWQLLFRINMEKRAFERVEANVAVKYYFDDRLYSGTVKNISEKGMLISTGNFLPCIDMVEILIPLEDEISNLAATIKRVEKINDSIYSMGIELLDPPDNYLEFVSNLRLPAKN
jgi:hypothetical protein